MSFTVNFGSYTYVLDSDTPFKLFNTKYNKNYVSHDLPNVIDVEFEVVDRNKENEIKALEESTIKEEENKDEQKSSTNNKDIENTNVDN